MKKYPTENYPREVATFKAMHDRVRIGKVPSIHWPRTSRGFYSFLECVGSIPKKMKRPSIGRLRHSDGYTPKNCEWQELSYNLSLPRRAVKRTPIWLLRMSLSQKGRKFTSPHIRNLRKARVACDSLEFRASIARSVKMAWRRGDYDNRKRRKTS